MLEQFADILLRSAQLNLIGILFSRECQDAIVTYFCLSYFKSCTQQRLNASCASPYKASSPSTSLQTSCRFRSTPVGIYASQPPLIATNMSQHTARQSHGAPHYHVCFFLLAHSDAPRPLYDFSEFGLGNVSDVCNAPVQRQVECIPSYEFFLGKRSACRTHAHSHTSPPHTHTRARTHAHTCMHTHTHGTYPRL